LTLALLLACGSASIRPADDPDNIAPAPSPAPSTPVVDADPAPPPAPAVPVAPPEAPSVAPEAPTDSTVEIRRIGRWVSSSIRGARRLVIRDPGTWSRFWSELGAGVMPDLDFSRDLVIAVASGERSTGGHDIQVRRVKRVGGNLRIEVLETSPGAGCLTTTALTQPVDVVVVPAAGITRWSFIDRTLARDC
jgi:hypothetical protein